MNLPALIAEARDMLLAIEHGAPAHARAAARRLEEIAAEIQTNLP